MFSPEMIAGCLHSFELGLRIWIVPAVRKQKGTGRRSLRYGSPARCFREAHFSGGVLMQQMN